MGWGAQSIIDDELALYRSGVANPQMNGVMRAIDTNVQHTIERAKNALDGVPWLWWVGPDSSPGLADELTGNGAAEVAQLPVMAVQLDQVARLPEVAGLTIEPVEEADSLTDWVRTFAAPLGIPDDDVDAVAIAEAARVVAPGDRVRRFVGRVDDTMVATAMLLESDGVAGIYVVATAATHRRRGFGARLTEAALSAARQDGLHVATLQATEQGQPVYEGMGFDTVAHYRLFTL